MEHRNGERTKSQQPEKTTKSKSPKKVRFQLPDINKDLLSSNRNQEKDLNTIKFIDDHISHKKDLKYDFELKQLA